MSMILQDPELISGLNTMIRQGRYRASAALKARIALEALRDEATMAEEQAMVDAGHHDGGVEEIEGVPPQIIATPGLPERQAVGRRQARVREIMHTLPPQAQEA